MNIKIELDNPKYCNGCLLMNIDAIYHIRYYMLGFFKPYKYKIPTPRPQKCIEENGE